MVWKVVKSAQPPVRYRPNSDRRPDIVQSLTKPRAVDARWPKRSPFSPQCPPRLWPSCAADGAIRTALALPLRGASPCSSEPPQARTATRSLARTTHLPDLPASCWHRLPHPHTITSAAPLALTFVIVKVTSCRTGP